MSVSEFNVSRVLQLSKRNSRQGRKASIPDVCKYRKKAYPAEREKADSNTAGLFTKIETPRKQGVGAERDGRNCLSLRILFRPWDNLETRRRF